MLEFLKGFFVQKPVFHGMAVFLCRKFPICVASNRRWDGGYTFLLQQKPPSLLCPYLWNNIALDFE